MRGSTTNKQLQTELAHLEQSKSLAEQLQSELESTKAALQQSHVAVEDARNSSDTSGAREQELREKVQSLEALSDSLQEQLVSGKLLALALAGLCSRLRRSFVGSWDICKRESRWVGR